MASVSFEITVKGKGSASLPVEFDGSGVVEIEGIGAAPPFPFSVKNTLDRAISIPLEVIVSGPSRDKVSVSLDQDLLQAEPGQISVIVLIIEADTPLDESDSAVVVVRGAEA